MPGAAVEPRLAAASRQELVLSHLAFVVKVATEFRGLSVPLAELVHEGNLGLLEAARRYDPAHGVKFVTYAVFWIRKAILKALPRHTEEELARRLSRKPSQIARIRTLAPRIASLDEPDRLREGEALRDRLADPSWVDAEQRLIGSQELQRLHRVMAALPHEQRQVIRHRYGLCDGACLTLREVGERIGVSRERVRQIESAALQRMRRMLSRR